MKLVREISSGFWEITIVEEWMRDDLLNFYAEKLKETELEIKRIKKMLDTYG